MTRDELAAWTATTRTQSERPTRRDRLQAELEIRQAEGPSMSGRCEWLRAEIAKIGLAAKAVQP